MKCASCSEPLKETTRGGRRKVFATRGLCYRCYGRHRYNGTLDQVAEKPTQYVREMWSRQPSQDGYMTIKTPDGIIGEHRYKMQEKLGRKLLPGETVHHINGVRDDNRLENLELWYSPQPYGQRVEDLIRYLTENHRDALIRELE